MEDKDSDQRPDSVTVQRRRFLQQSAGVGVGLGSIAGLGGAVRGESNGGNVLWKFVTTDNYYSDNVYGSPTVVDGTVYFGTINQGSSVYALDASDGSQEWKLGNPNNEIYSSPNVVNGTVYVGSTGGTLYAIDAASGTVNWTVDVGAYTTSPTVFDGTVYVTAGGSLYALNSVTAEREWEYTQMVEADSSPLVVDGRVYLGDNGGQVHAVDANSGEREWAFDAGGDVRGSPTVSDGTIYVGSRTNELHALDAETGIERWSFSAGGNVFSSPTVSGGTVYVGSLDNFLYAIDAETGTREWGVETNGNIYFSSPTVAGNTVFIGTAADEGKVYAVDAESGSEQWSVVPDTDRQRPAGPINSSPVVVDGVLYIGGQTSAAGSEAAMFAIDAGVSASSEGTRVEQGVLGHHDAWAEQAAVTQPVADAGEPQTVDPGEDVALNGTDSADPNGDTLTYSWEQTAGPSVSLSGADTDIAVFTAPDVDRETDLTFALTVDDGGESDIDTTTVTVTYDGPPPIAGDQPPTDPDDDGLYEDITGDGELDIFDVQALFNNLDNPALTEHAAAFNFDGDDEENVGIFDIQALFQEVQEQGAADQIADVDPETLDASTIDSLFQEL